jgi:hypothetical protein
MSDQAKKKAGYAAVDQFVPITWLPSDAINFRQRMQNVQ